MEQTILKDAESIRDMMLKELKGKDVGYNANNAKTFLWTKLNDFAKEVGLTPFCFNVSKASYANNTLIIYYKDTSIGKVTYARKKKQGYVYQYEDHFRYDGFDVELFFDNNLLNAVDFAEGRIKAELERKERLQRKAKDMAEAAFKVVDGDSWTDIEEVLKTFRDELWKLRSKQLQAKTGL